MSLNEGVQTVPYVYARKIRFGETDAATIVYTARFFDYALDAIDAWYVDVLMVSLYELNVHQKLSCPFVHASIDFKSALRPGDDLRITVWISAIGRSSLSFQLVGACQDGRDSFTGKFVLVFVDAATMRSIPIPPAIAQRAQNYLAACTENKRLADAGLT